jgi:hypothetical protein
MEKDRVRYLDYYSDQIQVPRTVRYRYTAVTAEQTKKTDLSEILILPYRVIKER